MRREIQSHFPEEEARTRDERANTCDREGRENVREEGLWHERAPTREEKCRTGRPGRSGGISGQFKLKLITINFGWAFKVCSLPGTTPCHPARPRGLTPSLSDPHLSTHSDLRPAVGFLRGFPPLSCLARCSLDPQMLPSPNILMGFSFSSFISFKSSPKCRPLSKAFSDLPA